MEIIIHRINKINLLKKIPSIYGVEIDIRSKGSDLILNHDPYSGGDNFIDYIDNYKHGTLILNIKEDGIENDVLKLVRSRGIESYFLLDVEFPYIYNATRKGEKNIAIRFSEDESIKTVEKYIGKCSWVWVDTNTRLPINNENINILNKFKTCLVCPERWNRSHDITKYKSELSKMNITIDAVMTSFSTIDEWK